MARSDNDALSIGVSMAVVYDVMSATNSSPQTTEINAKTRADTLMKWVHIGLIQGGALILIMAAAEPPGKKWRPLIGGSVAMGLMWGQYVHARNVGIASSEKGTEND